MMDCIKHTTLWKNPSQATKILEEDEAKVEALSRDAKYNCFEVLCADFKAKLWAFDHFLLLAARM
jgi:hypothetical protein